MKSKRFKKLPEDTLNLQPETIEKWAKKCKLKVVGAPNLRLAVTLVKKLTKVNFINS